MNVDKKRSALFLREKIVIEGSRELTYSELYTKEFFEFINKTSPNYALGFWTDNVIYFEFLEPMLSIVNFLKENKIYAITGYCLTDKQKRIIENAATIAGVDSNINLDLNNWAKSEKLINQVIMFFSMICLLVLVIINGKKDDGSCCNKYICFVRTAVAKQRVFIDEDIGFFEEKRIGIGNIYTQLSWFERICVVLQSYKNAKQTILMVEHKLAEKNLGYIAPLISRFLCKRLVHVHLWEKVVSSIIKKSGCNYVVSGGHEDSYGHIEHECSKKYGKIHILIPHGVEFGYRLPGGLAGDIFFATSSCAANELQELYPDIKFIYDEEGVRKGYSLRKSMNVSGSRRVVYFSSGDNSGIDKVIIEKVAKALNLIGIPLLVKLHPGESKSRYGKMNNVLFINDFKQAIANNVCIARFSTVLVEAIYNNSVPVRICLSEDSFSLADTVPSLNDSRIKICKSIDGLIDIVLESAV